MDKGGVWLIVGGDFLPPVTGEGFRKLLESGRDVVVFSALIWRDTRLRDGGSLLHFEDFVSKLKEELLSERDFVKDVPVENWGRESNNIDFSAKLKYVDGSGIIKGGSIPA